MKRIVKESSVLMNAIQYRLDKTHVMLNLNLFVDNIFLNKDETSTYRN